MAQLAPNPFAGASPAGDVDFPASSKKGPIVLGVIVVIVAAAAGVAFALRGSTPAVPPAPVAPPQTATAQPEQPAAPAPTPEEAAATPPPAHPSDDIAGKPAAAADSGDFSKMFAQGAEQAEKSEASSAEKAFNAEAARAAVAGVLTTVAACKEPGGPTGQSNASVTFDASGRVSNVTIGSPFAGTSTGTCIITAFRAAKVPPFSGLPGTVSQPVSLQ